MRFVATTGSTRTIVYGDAFEQNELSPVETLVVSLAACSAMDVIAIAAKKRQVIDRYASTSRRAARRVPAGPDPRPRGPRGRGPRRRGGGDPPGDRAVGHEVLPGQRDDLGGRDRGPPRVPRDPAPARTPSTPRARSSSPARTAGPTSSPEDAAGRAGRDCGTRAKVVLAFPAQARLTAQRKTP